MSECINCILGTFDFNLLLLLKEITLVLLEPKYQSLGSKRRSSLGMRRFWVLLSVLLIAFYFFWQTGIPFLAALQFPLGLSSVVRARSAQPAFRRSFAMETQHNRAQ